MSSLKKSFEDLAVTLKQFHGIGADLGPKAAERGVSGPAPDVLDHCSSCGSVGLRFDIKATMKT
jgi:hypothetical protein